MRKVDLQSFFMSEKIRKSTFQVNISALVFLHRICSKDTFQFEAIGGTLISELEIFIHNAEKLKTDLWFSFTSV